MATRQAARLAVQLKIVRDRCGICGACVPVCPSGALVLHDSFLELVADRCSACEKCVAVCPTHALALQEGDGA